MRSPLASLEGRSFDIVVVGGGINGTAAAQAAAAEGYNVALFEKSDFGSGATARSSRLLHCGLRYLVPGGPLTTFLRHPDRFLKAIMTVRRSMAVRSDFVKTQPERVKPIRMHYPIYADGPYAPWQVDSAFLLLRGLGEGGVPLDYERVSASQARAEQPFIPWLRNQENLRAVACYTEYQIDWPERVAVDMVLDLERLGGVARNYSPVAELARDKAGWTVTVADAETGEKAQVRATVVLNLAGVWVDRVNALMPQPVSRKITGTKGAHIVLRLPPECRGHGVAGVNRMGRPFYCMPWRDLHFFGPTETLYEGDPDDVFVDQTDLDFLLAESNHLLPGFAIRHSDIISTWAGIRPLTFAADQPMGARARTIADAASEGAPGLITLSNGSLGAHRATGKDVLAVAARHVRPSRPPARLSRSMAALPDRQNSPRLSPSTAITRSDVIEAVTREQARNLVDMLSRRTGLSWSDDLGLDAARSAAEAMAPLLGWDAGRLAWEVAAYKETMAHLHGVPPLGQPAPDPVTG